MSIGILLLRKLKKIHSPSLTQFLDGPLNILLAFTGWTKNNICVGGRKNKTMDKLKVEIKDAIHNTLKELALNI